MEIDTLEGLVVHQHAVWALLVGILPQQVHLTTQRLARWQRRLEGIFPLDAVAIPLMEMLLQLIIQPVGGTEDGIDVLFYPKLTKAHLDAFNEEQKTALLAGKVIVADVDDALLIVPLEEEQKIKLYVNEVKSKFGDKYL